MPSLFNDFSPHSAADWKNQLQRDLKGESIESLTWHNENGFDIQPFYTGEDLAKDYLPAFTHSDWDVCVKGPDTGDKDLNEWILNRLNSGATSILLPSSVNDFSKALHEVLLPYIHTSFTLHASNAGALSDFLSAQSPESRSHCTVYSDGFAEKGCSDTWLDQMKTLSTFREVNTCTADITYWHNQNPLAYYEIAIGMAALVDQLENLAASGLPLPGTVVLKTGITADYFVQMAKGRAIHRLWKLLASEYTPAPALRLVFETSLSNKSISDSYNNLLRSTIEAMAAVSGGCHELIVHPYDVFHSSNPLLSQRLAVNQQLILKEEAYLNQMADVACGSYYIETITDALASKALEAFKDIEAGGGYTPCVRNSSLVKTVSTQADIKSAALRSQQQFFIGINKFRNEKENIQINKDALDYIKSLHLHNPLLDFELEHFYKAHA